MKIEYDGQVYDYDYENLLVSRALKIEEHIGGTLADYEEGLSNGRAVCFQALGWLLFHDGNPKTPIGSVEFPVVKLAMAYLAARKVLLDQVAAELEEAAALAESDPTRPPSPLPSGPGQGGDSPAKATPENRRSGSPTESPSPAATT